MLSNFFSLRSHCAFGARSRMGGLHSLPCGKERSKKTELGKPSSQRFCSPAKHGRRASATAKLSRGSALWIPVVRGWSYRYFRPEAKMFVNIFPRLRK